MTKLIGIAMLSLAFTVASTAIAADAGHGACKADIEKLCKGVEGGEGRIAKCMKEHESEVSEACKAQRKARISERKDRRKAMREACKGDVERFCADKRNGRGDLMRCLREHRQELSKTCADAFPGGRGK